MRQVFKSSRVRGFVPVQSGCLALWAASFFLIAAVKNAVSAGVKGASSALIKKSTVAPEVSPGKVLAIADMFGHPPKFQSGLVPDFF